MTPENEVGPGPGRKMTPRQMGIVGAMIIIVLVIVWQVMGLFGGSSTPDTTITPAAQTNASTNAATTGATGSTATTSAAPTATPTVTTTTTVTPSAPPAPAVSQASQSNAELIRMQKETEEKYLAAVNELQMLKLQQSIAEANQAIAASKLATVTSEKSIADLLTKPAAPTESAYANNLTIPVPGGQQVVGAPTVGAPIGSPTLGGPSAPPSAPRGPVVPDAPYLVLSVSSHAGKWKAVLGVGGKLYNVSVGDVLPDTSVVTNINRDGVTLEKDKRKRKIPMSNMI